VADAHREGGLRGATEGGGWGVNESRIKFFSRIGLCPKFKFLFYKVINAFSNNRKMIPTKL
jgi:hypothetical protein